AKRQRAAALGAGATIDARSPDVAGQVRQVLGGSADIVFDCVSVQSSLDQAIAIADKGGTVMVVGVPAREVTVPLPIVQDHQIRIQGSATYLPEDYAESAGLLGRGAIRTADFVTATRPLAQVAEAFELASSGQHVKVLVTVGEADRAGYRQPVLAGAAEDQAAGGDAGARGDQDRAVAGDLVDRGAADLADRLGDAVHAVDVGLAELTPVRVDRQAAAQLDRAAGDEVPGLTAPAEAQLLQLDEHVRGEVVVQHG